MSDERTVYVLLPGGRDAGDHYQLLQEDVAHSTGESLGLRVEVDFAPAFDQLRVIKRRLAQGGLDAVVTEPSSLASMTTLLRDLSGRTGLVLLNSWDDSVQHAGESWGSAHPFATVSTDHTAIGEVQGKQVNLMLHNGGTVLAVTGPQRSSAAQERLEGLRSTLAGSIELIDTQAGKWTEEAGRTAFGEWHRVFKARNAELSVVAAQSDELAVGVRDAIRELDPAQRERLSRARLLGVDGCPVYGKRLVDEGVLAATIVNPANTGLALELLHRFWATGARPALRSFTALSAYPPASVPA
jgi:ABC-type sugar transport system substrate-binding protein